LIYFNSNTKAERRRREKKCTNTKIVDDRRNDYSFFILSFKKNCYLKKIENHFRKRNKETRRVKPQKKSTGSWE